MKKSIILMAIMFASVLPFEAVAQNNTNCPAGQQTEQCCNTKKQKRQKVNHKMRGKDVVSKIFNALNGINLTDEQKVKLFDLRETYTSNPAGEQTVQTNEEPRQKCQNLITEIKNILDDKQTKQFEENLQKMKTKFKKGKNKKMRGRQCQHQQPCQQGDSIICIKKK